MAFTLTDDHRRQLKVYKVAAILAEKRRPAPSAIALTEKMIDAGCKLARFVGINAYEAEGGTSRADLFENEVYLETPDLLDRLATEKLAAIRRELQSEGWGVDRGQPHRDRPSSPNAAGSSRC